MATFTSYQAALTAAISVTTNNTCIAFWDTLQNTIQQPSDDTRPYEMAKIAEQAKRLKDLALTANNNFIRRDAID